MTSRWAARPRPEVAGHPGSGFGGGRQLEGGRRTLDHDDPGRRAAQPEISARSVNRAVTMSTPTSQTATTTSAVLGSSRGIVARPPPKPPPGLRRDDGPGGVERQVLDDVGPEDAGELLSEVDGDLRADPRQLAARERGDREPERTRLD